MARWMSSPPSTYPSAQDEDRGPAVAGAAHHLPDEQGATAVHRDQERQRRQFPDRDVAEQVLADQRGEHGQREGGQQITWAVIQRGYEVPGAAPTAATATGRVRVDQSRR
jgi:hypothetical protein